MTGLELKVDDLHDGHGRHVNEECKTGYDLMEESQQMIYDDDLFGVSNDPSMFFAEFPTLPDFTCMSSSSSSSSPPQPGEFFAYTSSSSSATSSSASSWVVHNSEAESYHHFKGQHAHLEAQAVAAAAFSSTASMAVQNQQTANDQGFNGNMTENFRYMDLLDSNYFFDPSSILNTETPLDGGFGHDQNTSPQETHQFFLQQNMQQAREDGSPSTENDDINSIFGERGFHDDMAEVFYEWLKSNRGAVSAADLRKVKIRKATIESAARRLGGGREAMKQLFRLILEWVKSNIQKRRTREAAAAEGSHNFQYNNSQEPPCVAVTNMNLNSVLTDPSSCVGQSQWPTQPRYATDSPAIMAPAGFVGDPYMSGNAYQQSAEYKMLDSPRMWPGSQLGFGSNYNSFPDNNFPPLTPETPQAFGGYGCQYPFGQFGENGIMRSGSSTSKEARKKRMARQRMMSHHRHHNQQQSLPSEPRGLFGGDNCNVAPPQTNRGNLVYWQPLPAAGANAPRIIPIDIPQAKETAQSYQRQVVAQERRQGWKSEKNLKFLLQKVLKQSDVGSLGRIVLPKKEAETYLPELDARDGINIAMEDIGTSRVWNMRYRSLRFWPNNKSRMYLLENTGDFIRANGLQEGDFIVIYSDLKSGKYMIRGVKIRP